jgi:hypothetical protein
VREIRNRWFKLRIGRNGMGSLSFLLWLHPQGGAAVVDRIQGYTTARRVSKEEAHRIVEEQG